MKILLVGEYSRLHNSLKEGLQELGHSVTLIGTQDGFKNYELDIVINKKFEVGILKKFKNLLFILFKYDLESRNIKKQILSHQSKLQDFDIVQFINEAPFGCTAKIENEIFKTISSWNRTIYLLSCGTDYISVNYANQNKLKYSILTPYLKHKKKAQNHSFGLKFLKPEFKTLHNFIFNRINGVIASDIDYHIPLKSHPKYLGLIPNPINIHKLKFETTRPTDKVIIFHGINDNNYYKKGNDLFEKALLNISERFSEKIEIITTRSLPYESYIESYNRAHIVLDMIYAYDQGYNALEAMAKGKVVFTGAETEWLEYYNLKTDTVAINALPDVNYLIEKLAWLINNPNKISKISLNARKFIEKHHNYLKSAELYLETWQNNI